LTSKAAGKFDAVAGILGYNFFVRVIISPVARAVGVALRDYELTDEDCVSRRLLLSMHNQTLALILEILT
jgi:hypothetical protein